MPHTDADLLIVGGGHVGAALALAADAAGLSALLIDDHPLERRLAAEFDGRAYALAHASIAMLRALGVWAGLEAEAQPVRRIEIFDGRPGAVGPLRLAFDGSEIEARPVAALVEDRRLRQALLGAAAAREGIAQRAPARVAAMRVEPARAVLTLEDGAELAAPLVAACDGRRSRLAEWAGLARASRPYRQSGLVCAVEHDRPHEGVARQVFHPGGPFAMLPLTGGRSSLVWSERRREAARIAGLSDAAYLAEAARRAGGLLGRMRLVGRRWSYPLEASLAYRLVAPRLALVGDAAQSLHPIAGQGLNVAFRDAASLAETVAEAARRGEDWGSEAVLERHQRRRRFDAASFVAGTDALARLFSTDVGPLRALRDLGLAAVDRAPALKRAFMLEAAGLAGAPPRLLRGERL
jgi:2-octaprenyl-6-methoxyphenol hydroxylase